MTFSKVQSGGQVTLPPDVLKAAGISPGDRILTTVIGPGEVRLTTFRPMSLDELLAKFPLDEDMIGKDVRTELDAAAVEQGDEFVARLRARIE